MRLALLTTDNREHHRRYDLDTPIFGPAIEALLQGLSERPELEIHVVACTQQAMSSPEKLAENIWFHLLDVPKSGWLRTGYQGCVRAMRGKLREIEPNLVHGQGTERECALAAVFSGRPNVLTLLGNMRSVALKMRAPVGSYLWCTARLESLALRRTGGVLCNSTYTESLVRPVTPRTWLVANAVRREFLDTPPARQPRGAALPVLLNVGTVAPYKRQTELITMARRLHESGHRFQLQLVGEPPGTRGYAARFREEITRAEQEGFARHLGPKSMSDLIQLLDGASALVHLSTEESFGLVAAEALARSLKFFGTAAGGITDIARDMEGAEVFPPGREGDLEEAIGRWLAAGCPRPTAAADEIRARYHPDVIAAEHLKIYHQFLNGLS
jgi:glycosyltransferase involved in cell wall biosynthesis